MSEGPSNAEQLAAAKPKKAAAPDTQQKRQETSAEEVRAVVQSAAARRAAERLSAPDAPLIPMSTDAKGIEEAANAEALLESMDAQFATIDDETWAKLDREYVCFVKCRNSHKPGRSAHALYLSEYPRSTRVAYDKWYARKVKEDPKAPYYQPTVLCQACLVDNQRMPLTSVTVVSPQGDIEIDTRWLWRRPRNTERAKVEGETRIFNSSLESQNIGRREALARSQKAGYEVHDA